MPEHMLTRDMIGWPACKCGFRAFLRLSLPEVYPGQHVLREKIAILEHINQVTDLPQRPVSPSDPFDVGAERAYPRAGVRKQRDGRWRLTLWDGPGVFHVSEATDPSFPDRYSAFSLGLMIIANHRKTGTRLNGSAAA